MSAFIDGTFSVVFHFSAPENDSATIVGGLKFKPDIESVDRAAREEVPDLARADDDIDAIRLSGADDGIDSIEWRRQWRELDVSGSGAEVSLFPDGKCRRQWRTGQHCTRVFYFAGGRQSENVEAQDIVLQELDDRVHLLRIVVDGRKRRIRCGETVR